MALRALWANHIALESGDPYGYLDESRYHDPEAHRENVEQLLQEWERLADRDPLFAHYQKNYCQRTGCPPVWLAGEAMSFGLLSKFFANLKNRDPAKRRIAAGFGFAVRGVVYLGKTLRLLVLARNRVAHHSRFWDYRWTTFTLSARGHGNIEPLASALVGAETQSTYYVLSHVVFLGGQAQHPFSIELRRLLGRLPANIGRSVLRRMGFPGDWESRELWKAQV